jgi:hypothetical protein
MVRCFPFFAFLGFLVACSSDPAPVVSNTAACEQYCAEIDSTCKGANAQYIDLQTCKSMCSLMDPGASRDVVGDSIACRRNAVSNAKEVIDEAKRRDPCFQAGPYTTRCAADECAAFCKLDLAVCTGSDAAYANLAECQAACGRIKAKQSGFATDPLTTTTTGNSLICRAYHLEAASTNRAVHCSHTKETGGPCN